MWLFPLPTNADLFPAADFLRTRSWGLWQGFDSVPAYRSRLGQWYHQTVFRPGKKHLTVGISRFRQQGSPEFFDQKYRKHRWPQHFLPHNLKPAPFCSKHAEFLALPSKVRRFSADLSVEYASWITERNKRNIYYIWICMGAVRFPGPKHSSISRANVLYI